VLTVDDGSERYVQALVEGGTVHVESAAEEYLAPDQQLSPAERRALTRLGFQPPDGSTLNWWQDLPGGSVSEATDLLVATLREVHGAADLGVTATIARAAHHPANLEHADDPAAIDFDTPTVPSLADALTERLGGWMECLGVDAVWATVDQPGWPHFAHLGSNLDGSLYTEVSGDELSPDERTRLHALGWDDADAETEMHPRVWPAPFDLAVACWHVALTLVAVHGLQLDEPILVTLEPFG
jgi:hypothetical protein